MSISFQNLTKKFGFINILEDINLRIEDNQIFGLIGLNGAGKTTIIKCLLNIYNQYEGEIFINNVNAKNEKSRENIYYLPEKFMPSASLTGKDFINISSSFYKNPLNETQFIQYSEMIGFDIKKLSNQISTYSKGMAQKIGIIAAFASNASILILDEPMSGLDPEARLLLKKLMKDYIKKDSKLIFFSSHILSDVEELCKNIAIINKKKLLYFGQPNGILKENRTFEQSFLDYL